MRRPRLCGAAPPAAAAAATRRRRRRRPPPAARVRGDAAADYVRAKRLHDSLQQDGFAAGRRHQPAVADIQPRDAVGRVDVELRDEGLHLKTERFLQHCVLTARRNRSTIEVHGDINAITVRPNDSNRFAFGP